MELAPKELPITERSVSGVYVLREVKIIKNNNEIWK